MFSGRCLSSLVIIISVITAETSTDVLHEDNKNNAIFLQDYLTKYGSYVREDPAPQLSSSEMTKRNETEKVDITRTPTFVEAIINFQKMTGLKPTGTITPETLALVNQPRCGVVDHMLDSNAPAEYKIKSIWKSKYQHTSGLFFITYSLPKSLPKSLKRHDFHRGLLSGMCIWETVSNVRFQWIADNSSTDVKIEFESRKHGDGYSFDGTGGTLAHAFYPEDGRLHYDGDEDWYLGKNEYGDSTKKDIFSTSLHELGHILGLLHSDIPGSIMGPIYKYQGTFRTLKIPKDDRDGIEDMYGKWKRLNPVKESTSACRNLYELYEKRTLPSVEPVKEGLHKIPETHRKHKSCGDKKIYKKSCVSWKSQGFCHKNGFIRVMMRRCKETCGFCPDTVAVSKRKPQSTDKASNLVMSVCDIRNFDSIITISDHHHGYSAYYFKDNFYFESKMNFESNGHSKHDILDSRKWNKSYVWKTDPKTIPPGSLKFKSLNFFHQSSRVHALIMAGHQYFAFDKSGHVHQYSTSTPHISFVQTLNVKDLFPGYPHSSVDAAYVEELKTTRTPKTVYSLFCGSRMWQFQETQNPDKYYKEQKDEPLFTPVDNRMNVDISRWHGVPACDVDSVFKYKGVPYFLKGNIFWPALKEEARIPRDITYNFFRCWKNEPTDLNIPSSCNQKVDENPGNGIGKQSMLSFKLTFFILSLNIFLVF